MNIERDLVANPIITVIIKYRVDLLWDELCGVFDEVPSEVKEQLLQSYRDAITGASDKLAIPVVELYEVVEDAALQKINGMTFSDAEVQRRLAEYGIVS